MEQQPPVDGIEGVGPTLIRVVIVEDVPSDAELMVIGLEDEGFAPDWQRVETGLDLIVALEGNPDLVLSDWRLPRFSGLDALRIVRDRSPDIPFVVVSGSIGEEAAIDALHRGADDYVLKDRMARLGPAARGALQARRAAAERRRATDQLAFQASVLANVRDAVIVSDLAGRVIYWNHGAVATFGWTAEEMLGHPAAAIAVADRSESEEALRRLAAGDVFTDIWLARRKDGREIWVESRTRPMTDAAGVTVGIIAVSRDVTEQRRLEAERERLAAAIDQANDAVVITDTDARIQYVNPAFEQVTGYTSSEVIGENPRILQAGVHSPSFYQAMWQALAAGLPWVAEFTNRRKDGSIFQERAHISPIRGAGGSVTSYVAVKHDVTRERELEAAASRALRDRAAIADTLARLPADGSPEATASTICAQIVGLSGLAAVALFEFEHDRMAMPLAFVTVDGIVRPNLRLPAEHSRHLHARAMEGPWIEAWAPQPDHPYGPTLAGVGAVALAEVPIRHAGVLVGLLVAVSGAAVAIEELTTTLPALAEFADLSGAILGPAFAERLSSGRLHGKIRATIETLAFHPVYQPIVDLETSKIVGFEALTRFDEGGRPDLVFADAWSVGLGPELEYVTLRAAIENASGLPDGRWLSVNASPRLFEARPDVAALFESLGRPLIVEVTENEAVRDYDALRAAIHALVPGARIAVDDAGAGAANFAHIVGLRPDLVKLDMSLVRGIDRDPGRQALVAGMRHFARATGCRLVAEGIETREEADTLASLGAELGQGYLYGRPEPLAHWLAGAGREVTRRADPR